MDDGPKLHVDGREQTMKRRTLDLILTAVGAALVVILVVAGALLLVGASMQAAVGVRPRRRTSRDGYRVRMASL